MPRFDSLDLPLALGGNVFGWTADQEESFAVLDGFVEAGGALIDTADGYSAWVDGNEGGESEAIIGAWLDRSGKRDDVAIMTKVSQKPGREGLAADNIKAACEDSLARLKTDRLDLYLAHFDDEDAPLDQTFGAFEELLKEGKILAYGLSNYEPDRLEEALKVAPNAKVLQPLYNLVERDYETNRRPIAEAHELLCTPYYSLAHGFLAGKYRPDGDAGDSPRAPRARKYLESDTGVKVLEALDAVAEETGAAHATIALAWLVAQPTVLAPIASARNAEQLADLVKVGDLTLTDDQLERLTSASE